MPSVFVGIKTNHHKVSNFILKKKKKKIIWIFICLIIKWI